MEQILSGMWFEFCLPFSNLEEVIREPEEPVSRTRSALEWKRRHAGFIGESLTGYSTSHKSESAFFSLSSFQAVQTPHPAVPEDGKSPPPARRSPALVVIVGAVVIHSRPGRCEPKGTGCSSLPLTKAPFKCLRGVWALAPLLQPSGRPLLCNHGGMEATGGAVARGLGAQAA